MNPLATSRDGVLGAARSSYLAATNDFRDAEVVLGRATIADHQGAPVNLSNAVALHRACEARLDAARAEHLKAWIAFDASH